MCHPGILAPARLLMRACDYHNSFEAIRAPSAIDWNLAQVIFGSTRMETRDRRETAIGAGHHVLAPDQAGDVADALSDQLGMFDKVIDRIDHARDQQLVGRQLEVLEERPFMLVTRIRRLVRNSHRVDLEDDIDDVAQGDVAMMRTFVVAPAEMDTDAVGGMPLRA